MKTLDIFRNSKDFVTYEAGQVIFHEGEAGQHMYVVIEGTVEIRVKDTTIATSEAGAIFGEMALIDDAPRSATAVAQTACKVVPIDKRRFNFLIQQTPFFALTVMRIMSERLRQKLQ